jgi:hypothetical protein
MSKRGRQLDPLAGTSWLHAFEEDTTAAEMYRSANGDFGSSRRPRRLLSFEAGGAAVASMPWPEDRLANTTGTWTPEGTGYVVRFPSASRGGSPGSSDLVLRVSFVSAARIRVVR